MAIDEAQHAPAAVRTFLIADVRGYTAYTREHGDAAAGRLAGRFAELAREAAAARGGEVLELRGDEALAVFTSPPQAIRAAVELLEACVEEMTEDPTLPLTVGVGVDLGQAVPVEGGYRGKALNMAARLCSKALAGEVLVTRAVAETVGHVAGLLLEDRGPLEMKGFDAPVDVVRVRDEVRPQPHGEIPEDLLPALPLELDTFTPLVDRIDEMRWLRGSWRLARRGRGRILFVSGPAGIGKTRLLAELAGEIRGRTGLVRYAGAGGAGTALALAALRDAEHATVPTLLVLDDLDVLGTEVVTLLGGSMQALARLPVMVIATLRDAEGLPALASLVDAADRHGDSHRILPPLDASAVQEVGRLYAGSEVDELPLESVVRASGGVAARVPEALGEWARSEASRRLEAAAQYLAAGKSKRSADLAFANNVIALKLGRLYEVRVGSGRLESCPYKGLDSFRAEDAAYFFGRERLVGELAARTVGTGLLGVLGASGSGKSSAVMAGLVPSLAAGLLPGSDRWRTVSMRPGEHPLRELETALTTAGFEADGEDPLARAVPSGDGGSRVVLIVDQFEELFAADVDLAERGAFLRSLLGACGYPERFVAVPTMRSDFYANLADHPAVAELFAENHVLIGPMSANELRRAIELPARRAGMHVEAALTDALVADVEEEPGGLPLLSTALVELWAARGGGWLALESYERSGGVRGAVARLAERSFAQFSEVERHAARRVLLRLVGAGEGGSPVRRRVRTTEFDLDRDAVARSVLGRFTQDRLLTQSDGWVEVAHEALIRAWPRLADWLEEDLEGHRLRAQLTQAAGKWDEEDRESGGLFRGARLSATLDWASTHPEELNELERTFLTESRQASEREAERQRRTNRRLRGLLVGVVVFLLVALVAGGLALAQRERAERERQVAFARELTYASAANLETDAERSILLAVEAVRTSQEAGVPVGKDALETLHGAVQASSVALTLEHPSTANTAFSPDGDLIATGGSLKGTNQHVVLIWDGRTGERRHVLEGHTGDVNDLNFSPDGSLLATVAADRMAMIWDPRTGERLSTLAGHTSDLQGVSFSNDGSLLATSGWDGTIRIWEVGTWREVRSIGTGDGLCYNAFSPDDRAVAVAHCNPGDTGTIWSVESGQRLVTLEGHEAGVVGVSFSPDGRRVATGSLDGTVGIWNPTTGERLLTLEGHKDWVFATPFSPDGQTVASASPDGTVRLWDARTGEVLRVLGGHGGPIGDVAWSPDGTHLITGGADGTAKVRPVVQDRLVLIGHDGPVPSVAFAAGGSRLVTAGSDGTARLWDVSSGEQIDRFDGPDIAERITPVVVRVAALASMTSDGSRLLTAGGAPAIREVSSGRRLVTLDPRDDASSYPSAVFSPDERLVAVGASNGTATLFDARTGTLVRSFEHSDQPDLNAIVYGVGFSLDGSLLATASADGTAKVWSVDTGDLLLTFHGHEAQVHSVDFSKDGQSIVTSSQDGVAKIWDARTGRGLATLRGHAGVLWDAEFAPDGRRVATAGADNTVRVWDASTGREVLRLIGHTLPIRDVTFSPDGRVLASASDDGTVRVYHLRLEDLMRVAAERVSRTFSESECRQYLHVATCPS